jgi:hypothetical protein
LAELQQKSGEIKHSVNAEKLATVTTVLTKAPLIVSRLQGFTQALNAKAGLKPEGAAGENQ